MSERFGPFCKTVRDAATCKAFNDAGGENKSQAQTNPQKARPPGEMGGSVPDDSGTLLRPSRTWWLLFNHPFHEITDDRQLELLMLIRLVHHEYPEGEKRQPK